MSTTIKVALAGAGAFGTKHLGAIRLIDDVEVVSVVGRELAKTKEVAAKYGILAIPTVIVFKGGEVKGKFVGMQSKDALAQALQNALTG